MKKSVAYAIVTMMVLASPAAPTHVGQAHAQEDTSTDPTALAGFLKWREIGPAVVGGRISDLAVDEADSRNIYVGTATGGVWKSTNHGTTWTAVFTDQSTASIGDVTLAPSNPNVVWVGTGEPQNRQSSPWGDGVFKSMDGGRTWTSLGLEETRHISRIQVHPRNPDIAYVAAVGNLWKSGPERGVYKTTDGGATWDLVLFVDDQTGAIDLIMDPADPNTLFAAMYQRQRTAWGFNGAGPGSGIYRTLDGGVVWERLGEGLPDGDLGRIGLDVYRRDGNLVFATVQARRGQTGVYASKDRGNTWEKLSNTNPRPMYFSMIRVDPNNPERVYVGGQNLMRSDDGGRTFTSDGARNVHLDHHALWIDPANSNHLVLGSDGGVSASFDGSETWRFYDNLPVSQFYEIGFDTRNPYWVCGGLQDNGSWCGPTNTLDSQGIRNADWQNIGGGDGFYVQIDPEDTTVLYAESQGGRVRRVDLETGERASIAPAPNSDLEEGSPRKKDYPSADDPDPEDSQYRFNWNTPTLLSIHDRNTVYTGSQMLMRSSDQGMTWSQISPDLTFDIDRSQLPIMGATPTDSTLSRHDGVSTYSTLTTVGESPINADVLYTGSDDGRVMGTQDGGVNWTDLTPGITDLPANTYVSRLVPSNVREGRVYATFDGHYSGDFGPYVYVSNDFGATWASITTGLPNSSVNIMAEHPDQENLLFVGNEVGVYVSTDRGSSWAPLMNGLPTVPVDDIKIHPDENDLIIGTHGRGIWVMDNIAPLDELATGSVAASNPYLFRVGRAIDWRNFRNQEWTASGEFRIPNPSNGARIRYWLPEGAATADDEEDDRQAGAADGEGTGEGEGEDEGEGEGAGASDQAMGDGHLPIKIMTATGQEVRTLEGPSSPGAHEVVWDFRLDPPHETQGAGAGGGGGGGGGAVQGPKVLPGVYQIQIEVGETTMLGDLVVRQDPRIEVSRGDLTARQAAIMSAYDLESSVYDAGQAILRLRDQLGDVDDLLNDADDPSETLGEEVEAIREELGSISEDLDRLRVRQTRSSIEGSTTRPTEDQVQAIDKAWDDAPGIIEQLNSVISNRMPALNRRLDDEGIRADPGDVVEVPARGGR